MKYILKNILLPSNASELENVFEFSITKPLPFTLKDVIWLIAINTIRKQKLFVINIF